MRRDQHAGRAGDRLDDHGGDGRGVVQRDDALEVVGELGAVLRQAARERVALQVVGVAQVVDAAEHACRSVLRLPTMPPTEMPPKLTPW